MKMWKRAGLWVGVLAMLAAVVGCGSSGGAGTPSGNQSGGSQASGQQVLVVAGYGGSFQNGLEKSVIPEFEQQFHCKVTYIAGASTATLAKLQAQKANPQIDVALLDDGPQAQAKELGLLAPLDPAVVTNLGSVYDIAKDPDNVGVGIGITATGIAYNTKVFQENHWPAPTSWKDLANPKFKGKLVLPSIVTTYGVHMLVMEARVNGGGESNIEPGFSAMKTIAPSSVTFDTTADVSNYFLQGTAVASVWGQGRVNTLKAQGFPIEFVFPKEGAVALLATGNVVKNAPHEKLAQEFVNFLLDPKNQSVIAQSVYMGPTNKSTTLDDKLSKMVIYGPSEINQLVKMDWKTINANRAAWTDRWNKEIETQH
ncbi:ABC transporter substrate-binding protein [Alicyclobacillus macrosporangiidus]|uniref:Putative spermidine/putrescine transport system substrate-binding protein n=1 Tax=Alicyclobacillus macrosporangiidus TaxID=392015 RepID=A0A1I7LCH3_9BACL|nr:ABC transporter substrate-binding protein [Alicyclobacillus macrosporangiidus]SFV07403.1 putative spermidine/putrescine transport system substrate-binding protein [Alicyclobacillus macrosporangiidus]